MPKKLKIFLYGLLDIIKISLIGQLKLSEIFIIGLLPFNFKSEEIKQYKLLKQILIALLILFCCQIFTDIAVVHSALQDFLRGWAVIIISIISFLFFFKTLSTEKLIIIYFWTMLIRCIIAPQQDFGLSDVSDVYFKFRMVPILNYVVFLIAAYLFRYKKQKLIMIIFFLYAVVCFSGDARSNGLIFFLADVLIYIFIKRKKINRFKLFFYSLIFIILFQLTYMFYVNSVLNNELGGQHSIEEFKRMDNPYNPFELLMVGRGETFAAITAIADNPIFGHGSWAKDPNNKYHLILLQFQNNEEESNSLEDQDLIPSHSILLGSWVNCGIIGFIAAVWLFILLMKVSVYLIRYGQSSALYPILVVITVNIIWIFFFSTFQSLRYEVPPLAVILLSTYYQLNANKNFIVPNTINNITKKPIPVKIL